MVKRKDKFNYTVLIILGAALVFGFLAFGPEQSAFIDANGVSASSYQVQETDEGYIVTGTIPATDKSSSCSDGPVGVGGFEFGINQPNEPWMADIEGQAFFTSDVQVIGTASSNQCTDLASDSSGLKTTGQLICHHKQKGWEDIFPFGWQCQNYNTIVEPVKEFDGSWAFTEATEVIVKLHIPKPGIECIHDANCDGHEFCTSQHVCEDIQTSPITGDVVDDTPTDSTDDGESGSEDASAEETEDESQTKTIINDLFGVDSSPSADQSQTKLPILGYIGIGIVVLLVGWILLVIFRRRR